MPLEPQKEAKLIALAQEKGGNGRRGSWARRSTRFWPVPDQSPTPRKSAYGLLAKYGPGPSEEEIDENRSRMFRRYAEGASMIAGVADTQLWHLPFGPGPHSRPIES